jgi:hypothetical protein
MFDIRLAGPVFFSAGSTDRLVCSHIFCTFLFTKESCGKKTGATLNAPTAVLHSFLNSRTGTENSGRITSGSLNARDMAILPHAEMSHARIDAASAPSFDVRQNTTISDRTMLRCRVVQIMEPLRIAPSDTHQIQLRSLASSVRYSLLCPFQKRDFFHALQVFACCLFRIKLAGGQSDLQHLEFRPAALGP